MPVYDFYIWSYRLEEWVWCDLFFDRYKAIDLAEYFWLHGDRVKIVAS